MTDVHKLHPEAAKGDRYWAGGSARHWFVMLRYQPRWHPEEPVDYEIEQFMVGPFAYQTEAYACRAACAVADRLNAGIGHVLEK